MNFRSIFIESDSDDDALIMEYLHKFPVRRPRIFRDRLNPLDVSEDEFRDRYRLTKDCFTELLDRIIGDLDKAAVRFGRVLPVQELAIALQFYASGLFQINVGDRCGVSKATVCHAVRKVSNSIAKLAKVEVSIPRTDVELEATKQRFLSISGFPGVLGAIGCTHIGIPSPGGTLAELYRNRKGFFSFNVQAVASYDLKFQNVVCRWFGSLSDAEVFERSKLCTRFGAGEFTGSYLVGGVSYPCRDYLLTPLVNPVSPAELRYNASHAQIRMVIEQAFELLKKRFPCLRLGLRIKLEKAMDLVLACVVLHNLCISAGDVTAPDDLSIIGGRAVCEAEPEEEYRGDESEATAVRAVVISRRFERNS